MSNRYVKFGICILSVVALSATAWAVPSTTGLNGGTMNLSRTASYFEVGFNGGEFTLAEKVGDAFLSNIAYAASTKDVPGKPNSFQTFCIELNEVTRSVVDITVSTTNVDATGADVGPGSHAVKGGLGSPNGDNLEIGTAYLYTLFARGTLALYDYANTGVSDAVNTAGETLNRGQTAAALQAAIWVLEEGITIATNAQTSGLTTGQKALAAYYLTLAAGSGWTDIGSVRVLNLYDPGFRNDLTHVRQDMLYLIPAPAGLLLVAIGLGAFALVRRRLS